MSTASATLPFGAIDSIALGVHADPFAVLGPHDVTSNGQAGVAVRAFRPYAAEMAVHTVLDGRATTMTRLHSDGFFEAFLPGTTLAQLDYRLRATWTDGSASEFDDPYRYGPVLTGFDQHLFAEGTHLRAFDRLGARTITHGTRGVHFAVWAPTARRVSVVGDFNGWDGRVHPMRSLVSSGLWEIFLPELGEGGRYKFEVLPRNGPAMLKADPYGRYFETPPQTASIVYTGGFTWSDEAWLADRRARGMRQRDPMSVYEVHMGSWRRHHDGQSFSYRELAETLVPYVRDLGFTHIELMPIMEHPFGGSWGYQVIGFFAPTSRFGQPDDFKYFVDACHRAGIGVILDWVPGHFPNDLHGLGRFDGTALYEHADPRQGVHQDWGTFIFNYGRREVRSFLLSNALYWIEEFHADALRVDAVASMLYLDYSRKAGEWVPNEFGGRENLQAINFLHELNRRLGAEHPDVPVIAEESTSWPGVSPAGTSGRARLHLQVEHGLDARHAGLLQAGSDLSALPPPEDHLLDVVRIQRELHPAVLTRRSRLRQGLDDQQDAGRRLAEARQPACAVRLHVHPSGQEAHVHGEARSRSGGNGITTPSWTGKA